MKDDYLTDNWIDFSEEEQKEAIGLLSQVDQIKKTIYGKPTILKNKHSGKVFLSDEDYKTWMLHNEKIEEWYYCGNCGEEGFISAFPTTSEGIIYCESCKYNQNGDFEGEE